MIRRYAIIGITFLIQFRSDDPLTPIHDTNNDDCYNADCDGGADDDSERVRFNPRCSSIAAIPPSPLYSAAAAAA
eukprot:CAMPEP_0175063770 /NCGR_PEP_ID=MMETSP0052_2-20121109/14948_1 /TAXON_ID=51329 ORGANISM="Polytomella parva, Strain SAG 63-3" /NCGR_SAMPLE_ID=MMETSP0052_2 /ASSEMBLY_ACC=CAM_ASM_000194 /LENGTH=74 /DNA_ID=CAMNT_0016330019 /DNA_START=390 /DNA_END=611 /DNA_ORIENTATION=-